MINHFNVSLNAAIATFNLITSASALLMARAGAVSYQKNKPMDMHCHPTASGSSHLLEGVFLGVSVPNRNQESLKLPKFSA
jgi:hypothetical protein